MQEVKTVSIPVSTLIRECSKNLNLMQDHYLYFALKNRELIHQVCKYRKFNDDFVTQVDCFNDGENIIGMIRPSYDDFLYKLIWLLNTPITKQPQDDEKLTDLLLSRVERLKEVTSEQELEIEFPQLYRDLINGRRYYRDLQNLKNQEGYSKEDYMRGEHYYYACAMRKSLSGFIETQAECYRRFILRRKELQEKQEKTDYNNYIAKNFDLDKFYLLVIHFYLLKAESMKDKEEIKKYIKLIEMYCASSRKKDVSITTDAGQKIDYNIVLNRLENLKRYVYDNSSMVEWIMIPEGKRYQTVSTTGDVKIRSTLMTMEELMMLRSKGERKTTFYEKSPYLLRAIGLRKYQGYIAYIYENGEVILDREYNPYVPTTATGDAIYRMHVNDFEALSKLDKQELMKHPSVKRMNHTPTWEKRLAKVINRKASEKDKVESKQLVLKLIANNKKRS